MHDPTPASCGYYLDEYDGPRFWGNVDFNGGLAYKDDPLASAEGECWQWRGLKPNAYVNFTIYGRRIGGHRLAYLDAGRTIPKGYDVDHLCRNPSCVNPDHLEAVTHVENVARGKNGSGRQRRPAQRRAA